MIHIFAVGKVKEKWIREGCAEYSKRLKNVQIGEIKDYGKEKEGVFFLEKIRKAKGTVVALHETGKTMNSLSFAAWLKKQDDITFLIGSADGLASSVLKEVYMQLRLSDLTFPHERARLLFLEQLYRAQCINQGKTYHR